MFYFYVYKVQKLVTMVTSIFNLPYLLYISLNNVCFVWFIYIKSCKITCNQICNFLCNYVTFLIKTANLCPKSQKKQAADYLSPTIFELRMFENA